MNDIILSTELPNLAIYGSHNASVVLEHKGEILEIVEMERFLNVKNIGYAQYLPAGSRRNLSELILEYFKDNYGFDRYGTVIHQCCDTNDNKLTSDISLHLYHKMFPADNYVEMRHHHSHAAGAFYQSPFEKALVFSFDGGGNDGFFNAFICDRENGPVVLDSAMKYNKVDLGFAYMIFGEYIEDIRKESCLSIGNLVYSGKILGYQSYGKVVDEWYEPIKEFYRSIPEGRTYSEYINVLGDKIGLKFDINNRFKDDVAQNLAATSQRVFEDLFFEMVDPIIKKHEDYPICLTGGCALNIVLNTKVKERYNRPVFVGPGPNDCGMAVGMILQCLKPKHAYDVSYLGMPVVDKYILPREIEERGGRKVSVDCIVNDLFLGRIVGVLQNRSEHGPRALGNRSIICSPLGPDMKDILNFKVKDREWYRPFAPIVRLEDVSEYFEWEGPSEFMSFCPKVKMSYRHILPSITHVDGTARVQTITKEKNPFMYDVLTLFKQRTNIGVLINTSFNLNGKPILSSYTDAFKIYERTQLDALYLNGYYFTKHRI